MPHTLGMKSSTAWRGHSTQPSLPAGTARKASGHLSGRRPLHLANARPFGRSKAPLGLLLLRKRELALAGRAGSSCPQQRKTECSRRGTPCCTYRCCLWLLAGCVRVGAPCFCFALNLLAHGFRLRFSNIPSDCHSESNRHSPMDHCR